MANDTVLQWAGATNVGQVRSNNEDRYLTRDDGGLWVVADGMGGHRGGEIASQIACEQIAQRFDDQTISGLVDAIESANAAVFQVGADDPDLAGMGTTVVALAIVADGNEEVLAVANVGDSRAYRLDAEGQFEQLTEDHSLVADMVREGSITAEEAASHPQRNILTRVLGVYEDVPVDVITVSPRQGDRFLLCSDGLFNEMPEDRIASVLRRLADPDEAVDELVRLAFDAGGRDNITVVLVDVLGDGDQARVASGRLAPTEVGRRAAAAGPDTAVHDGAYPDADSPAGGAFALDDEEDEVVPRHSSRLARARRPRLLTWRAALFTLLVLVVLGGAFATIQWYGRSAYFVGFAGNDVAIFQGRPGGVLWIDPELVERTELNRDDVPADTVATIQAGKQESSRDEAEAYVRRLNQRIQETQATTTTTTVPFVPPATVPGAQPPPPA